MLLEIASQNEDRGSVEAFDPEVADALFDMPDGAAQAIYDALCSGKNPRIADGCILSWRNASRKGNGMTTARRNVCGGTATGNALKRRETQVKRQLVTM